jgi:hypothetical protein
MSRPQSSKNTYTCTCAHFCGGYKAGLSRATYYRHAPYRDAPQPSFSPSFQNFLDNSAGSGAANHSGTGQEESHSNAGSSRAGFPTSHALDTPHNPGNAAGLDTAGVISFLIYPCSTEALVGFRSMICLQLPMLLTPLTIQKMLQALTLQG